MKHPGFKAVASKIARKEGVSKERASAMLAASSRHASAAAKRHNPNLKRVKGKWYVCSISLLRIRGMKTDDTKVKGSDQPPTQVRLDDKRTEQKKEEDKKDGMTDKVMEHQSKDHQVQRT